MSIQFDVGTTAQWRNAAPVFVDQPEGGETPSGASDRESESTTVHLSDEDKALMEDMRLAQLMTDNPMAYEQEMIDAQVYPRVANGSGQDD